MPLKGSLLPVVFVTLFVQCLIGLMISQVLVVQAQTGRDLDTFNYRGTVSSDDNDGVNDYGPSDWDRVQCSDVDTCVRFNESLTKLY